MKKKKFKDLLYMNTLRNQIKTLNIKLEKKQEEISDYKKYNDNNKDFNSLENDLISDYDKLKELKYKNAKMVADLEDFAENYFLQREENIKLKNRLKDFIESFNNYKENAEKNNTCLEKKIKYFEEKNLECLIYHSNIGKNSSRFLEDNRSKLTEAGNLIEKINEEIAQINNDIKSKEKNLNEYKNEIDILNNKKKEINENKEKNEENIKNMDIKKEESDKKNKEKENINKNLKKELKEKKNKYKNIINKIKDINDIILQRDEEIIQLKEDIEKLKASKNVFYY
jgi:chromosome segregation ATPase